MEQPRISVTDAAKAAIKTLLDEIESEPLSVVIVWASPKGQDSWWWSLAFHPTSQLGPEFRFQVSGMDFYFDGPFFQDERTLDGKTIDYFRGVFTIA